jgi:hypothetical protein
MKACWGAARACLSHAMFPAACRLVFSNGIEESRILSNEMEGSGTFSAELGPS